MGQKTNSNLLRLNISNNEWKSKNINLTPEENSLTVFKSIEVNTYIEQFLSRNGLIFHKCKIQTNRDSVYLYISYFVSLKSLILINQNTTNQKLILKKRKADIHQKNFKILKRNSNSVKQPHFSKDSQCKKRNSLVKLYKNYLNKQKHTNEKALKQNHLAQQLLETLSSYFSYNLDIFIIFQNLNSNVTLELKQKVWKKKLLLLKRYKKNKFFKESINILLIAIKLKNSSELISSYLAKQFSILNRHSFFLAFLKRALILFVNSTTSKIAGLKIIVSGRFNKRPRARNNIINIGSIPTQTLNLNVNYHQSVAFSSNGTFGIKVWIAEKP